MQLIAEQREDSRMTRQLSVGLLLLAIGLALPPTIGMAQGGNQNFQVEDSGQSVDIIVGTSRRLRFDYRYNEAMVENPDVIKATPAAANELLVTGLKPGLSTVTIADEATPPNLQTITVHVGIDVRKLEHLFKTHFPGSAVSVHPLETGVLLKGYVSKAAHIENIVRVATDFFPTTVINQIQVDGSQLVAIKVKVYEVSRTKLRKLGVDWAFLADDVGVVSSVSGLISSISTPAVRAAATAGNPNQNLAFGVLNDSSSFDLFIQALEQNNLAKLLDQPTLVTQHGRPAEFLSGGELPIAVPSGLGTTSIEFRPFGTKLDIVPLIHGGGEMTLEVRAEVSEVANDLSNTAGVPGFRVRRVNTGVKMMAGQTLALAGDYREETETEHRGVPFLMDHPWWGSAFRRVEETVNETELVFLITPKFISPIDPQQAPRLGPGQLTSSPSDHELYMNGYTEVPRCNDDCPVNDRFDDPSFNRGNQPRLLPQANIQQGTEEASGQNYMRPNQMQQQGFEREGTFQPASSTQQAPAVGAGVGSWPKQQTVTPPAPPATPAKRTGFRWPSQKSD